MAIDYPQQSNESLSFQPLGKEDPAIPGDPWSRVRYRYGQLLGAEDFTAEQRATILRHRLHLALLHGMGTVRGLRVDHKNEDAPKRTVLTVQPGLAVDALGREIYVPEEQCLDITGLCGTAVWKGFGSVDGSGKSIEAAQGRELAASMNAATGDKSLGPPPEKEYKRAYVVLWFEACLSEPAPAITPPCSDAEDAFAYSRVTDGFRIELTEKVLDISHQIGIPVGKIREHLSVRAKLAVPVDRERQPAGPREMAHPAQERFLDHILGDGEGSNDGLAHLWQSHREAPVLLAAVDLETEGDACELVRVAKVHNSVRPLLPSVQSLVYGALGKFPDEVRGSPLSLTVKDIQISEHVAESVSEENSVMKLTVVFGDKAPVLAETLTNESVRIFVLHESHKTGGLEWKEVPHQRASSGPGGWGTANFTLEVDEVWKSGTVYQVHLTGSGPKPILGQYAVRYIVPLAGWESDPAPTSERGRDVSIVRTWKGPTPDTGGEQ